MSQAQPWAPKTIHFLAVDQSRRMTRRSTTTLQWWETATKKNDKSC